MATLVLGAAGAAAGSALLPAGVSVLGATLGGAAIGRAAGTLAGAFIDQALFGASGQAQAQEGPRLSDTQVTASTAGTPIPRLYGRARLGAQLIWATNLEEVVESSGSSGTSVLGKGLGSSDSGGSGGKVYKYFANFAVAICEGEISHIGRVWANGDEINLSDFTHRVYKGTETQTPDSLIESKEGTGNAPAYRGTAYIVFERMPLAKFGNRIPQLNVEVFRPVDDLERDIQAVCMIPAATEFGYEPETIVIRDVGAGAFAPANKLTSQPGTDWSVSLDNLQDIITNTDAVSVFVTWFGDDLRCDKCDIKPMVDTADKDTQPYSWKVQGITRGSAEVVSDKPGGGPAFGGTPADQAVRDALVDLQDRGLNALLTPFLLMDVPENNGLSDPYDSTASDQPVYPWRGRITCDPAPGETGTVDQTSTARTQVDAFLGTCAVSDFTVTSGNEVSYSGPSEWSYRRFILHYAHICKAAENISGTPVEAFVIGTEQPFLSFVRDQNDAFPFVDGLVALAADVKSVLPNTKVTYAADWSEFVPYQTSKFGGPSGEIFFHLDPLWSSSNIDALGIDNYWPLSDWRDGQGHLDYLAGTTSIYDQSYLRGNIEGGEGYDWFYASQADRDSQTRTDITDSLGKPWVFRFKDIKSWWENDHFDRPGGTENTSSTGWTPESKPFWMMELGCPALDKGSNQPNVFFDPKSSESQLPYFSNGTRDDLMQRRHITAFLGYWDPNDPDFAASNNPQSSVYSGRMVDLSRVFIYTWDARPYPMFPNGGVADATISGQVVLTGTIPWADADNWKFGHWITGRASDAPVSEAIRTILSDYGFTDASIPVVPGDLSGYVIERNMTPRDALQPLETTFFFDTVESGGTIALSARGQAKSLGSVDQDGVAENGRTQPRVSVTRGQETELPGRARISYFNAAGDYESASVETLKLTGASDRVSSVSLAATARQSVMYAAAEKLAREQWAARERLSFALPPSMMKAEPGDLVTVNTGTRNLMARITRITQGESLQVEAVTYEAGIYDEIDAPDEQGAPQTGIVYPPPEVAFMDLPLITGNEVPHAGYVAAYSSPFGGVDFYRSPGTTNFNLNTQVPAPSSVGKTGFDLFSGPVSRFDRGNVLRVRIFPPGVQLESVDELSLFNGANTLAVEGKDGNWEVLQFRDAQLVSQGVYDISTLLRGQYGTEDAMADPVASGARVVLLDGSQAQVGMSQSEIGLPFNWRYGPSPAPLDNFAYTTVQHAFTGRGLKPFSPVHVEGSRDGSGDLTISWIRRARLNGDAWEQSVVPLNEPSENYEVDILDGATVKRTLTSTSPSVVYTAADQVADFGSAQGSVDVVVYQMSDVIGRGVGRESVV